MKYFALTLAASLALASNSIAVLADTTTTETTTTTVETSTAGYVLPTGSYIAVDPTTGVSGVYDISTRLYEGHPLTAGTYLIDQNSGRVIATTDMSGNLVECTTVPTVLPHHFVVMNGKLMYFATDYGMRRAQLMAEIQADYDAGRLSNRQAEELRNRLAEEAALESKRRDDGTYSSSTVRSIERKLALVQADLAKNVADISSKRAKIGLKVN